MSEESHKNHIIFLTVNIQTNMYSNRDTIPVYIHETNYLSIHTTNALTRQFIPDIMTVKLVFPWNIKHSRIYIAMIIYPVTRLPFDVLALPMDTPNYFLSGHFKKIHRTCTKAASDAYFYDNIFYVEINYYR